MIVELVSEVMWGDINAGLGPQIREGRDTSLIAKVQRSRNHQGSVPPVIGRLPSLPLHAIRVSNRACRRSSAINPDPRMNARLSRDRTVVPVN